MPTRAMAQTVMYVPAGIAPIGDGPCQFLSQAQLLIYLLEQHQPTVRADKSTVKIGNNVFVLQDSELAARITHCHWRAGLPLSCIDLPPTYFAASPLILSLVS